MDAILLVEDDPGQARLAQKTLERAGLSVSHARSAAECLQSVRRDLPTFILLDRGLPDRDGLEVLRELRAQYPSICVIMLTGADDAALAVDAMRLGAWDYVIKRPDLSHLADLPLVLRRNHERLRLLREHDQLIAAMRASEERFRDLFDNASDAIFVCDGDGVLQQVNETLATLLGRERSDIAGHALAEFLATSSPTTVAGLRDRSARPLDSGAAELHVVAADGHKSILEVSTRPMANEAQPGAFQAIGRDVTARREIEQMKADFLAMVTHDMKNPVSIIVGYTEILLNDVSVASDWREMLVSIDSSARGLLHLIMNFLDLSKIEAGALRLHQVETSVNEVLHQVVLYQTPLARAKRITIVEELESVPPLRLDRGQMDRVFVNLIGNAIKFTPPRGQVAIKSASRNGSVEVSISDTGPGIPREQVPRLFGKYQRLAPAAQTEGTGLGLFIAKSMIDAHGGNVRVESEPSRGATFVVTLPIN